MVEHVVASSCPPVAAFGNPSRQFPRDSPFITEALRLEMKNEFAETCCRLVAARPETSSGNYVISAGDSARLRARFNCRAVDERTV